MKTINKPTLSEMWPKTIFLCHFNTQMKEICFSSRKIWMEIKLKYITFKNIEKITPCWSFKSLNSASRGEIMCLFNSQVPLLLFSENTSKFVEVHHVFLKHEWLQDIKLGDSNLFTTWPISRLFSSVLKYAERERSLPVSKIATFITHCRRKKSRRFLTSIFSRSRWPNTTFYEALI